ncbi:MAG: M28 family peptidase [Acidobacteriia bacterium]|nr:M28 family peptidase [Terriglobia bacterium]
MIRRATLRLLVGVLLSAGIFAGPMVAGESPGSELPRAIVATALGPTPVVDDLRHLADVIGGRPTGSPALDHAVEWGLSRLRDAGLENVHAEAYTVPHVWLPRTETAEVVAGEAGERTPLRVAAMPFSASTPPSGLEAEVVDVGRGDAEGFAAAGDRLRGRWVLIHSEPMKTIDDLFKEYLDTPGFFEAARKGGAAGILYVSNRPGRLLYRHDATSDGSMASLPAVVAEREGALRLARLLLEGRKVRLRVVSIADVTTNATARNVVGEIRGGEKPDDVVILGAHLDSWDLGRGALDNGCNAALVIDAARTIRSVLGAARPRRTLRFVLYTGEELGLFGSLGEVRAHRDLLDRVKAQVVVDEGTGRIGGFSLGGRADLAAATREALAPVEGLGPFLQTTDAFVGTDNYDYLVEGVPTLVANQDAAPYLADYHAESDTFDKADLRELKLNTAIVAVLVAGLAERSDSPAPRQSRAEVEALLRSTGLDAQMKLFGLWDDFEEGRRGRARSPSARR